MTDHDAAELLRLLSQQPTKPVMITIELSTLVGCIKEAFENGLKQGEMKDA